MIISLISELPFQYSSMIDNHSNDNDDKPTKGAKNPGSNPSHRTNLFSCGCKFYFYLTILSLAIMVVVVVMVMVMIMIRVRTCRDVVVTIWADSVQRVGTKHPDVNAMLMSLVCLLALQFGRKKIQCERITATIIIVTTLGCPLAAEHRLELQVPV